MAVLFLLCSILFSLSPAWPQNSASRFVGDPLLGGAGARSLSLGGAYVAISDDASAVYWNAAGLGRMDHAEVLAQHTEQFGGSVNHDVLALAKPTRAGGFGVGVIRVGVDDIKLTQLEEEASPLGPGNRPEIKARAATSDYALYLGFGHPIRTNLTLGVTIKVLWRNLVSSTGTGFGFDVGALFRPHDHVTLGVSVRDVTQTRVSYDSGTTDRISPSVLLGLAYIRPWVRGTITASTSVHINEDRLSYEPSRVLKIGAEYRHALGPALRLGLDGGHLTAGAGYRAHEHFGADFAFLENGDLDNTFRLSASLFF